MLSRASRLPTLLLPLLTLSSSIAKTSDDRCRLVADVDLKRGNRQSQLEEIQSRTIRLTALNDTIITTKDAERGIIIKALKRNKVVMSNLNPIADYNNGTMLRLRLGKAGSGYSPWYWLDSDGWCAAPIDILEIYDAMVYSPL